MCEIATRWLPATGLLAILQLWHEGIETGYPALCAMTIPDKLHGARDSCLQLGSRQDVGLEIWEAEIIGTSRLFVVCGALVISIAMSEITTIVIAETTIVTGINVGHGLKKARPTMAAMTRTIQPEWECG